MNRPVTANIDRAAAVRAAMRTLVAEHGFHGASMGAVARAAGVATGTAYVHYASKDDLVIATYLEVKHELGVAATAGLDPALPPRQRFLALWMQLYEHLAAQPERARFIVQVETSPYALRAHESAMAADGDPLLAVATAADMLPHLVALPLDVVYELGLGPAIRLAASGAPIAADILHAVSAACWRAITR